jgi:hypothetical protein
MVTKEQATALVQQRLDANPIPGDRVVVCEVDEHSWGWMFFYQSEKHLETGSISHALAGNCPLFVTKEDGKLHEPITGSGVPTEEHLRLFELKLQGKG